MLKFLRQYNKLILVVGGVFLMVVFLLPQAIHQFGPNPMSVVHFRADGKAFRGRDVYDAGKELQSLQMLQQVAYSQSGIPVPVYPQLDGHADSTHWLLLVRDAQDLGLVGGPEGGRGFLDELATAYVDNRFRFQQQDEKTANDKKQVHDLIVEGLKAGRAAVIDNGTPADMIDRTLAKLRGVNRLVSLGSAMTSLSTRETAYFGREFLDTAVADIIVIGTEDFVPKVPEPTEQQLQAFFDKYKSVDAKDDPNKVGYLRPPAVRVEALQIDRSVIRNAVKLDPIDVNKFWRQNQDKYGSDFNTAKPNVEAALRTKQVEDIMSKVEELLRREFFKSSRELETLDGGYKRIPPGWESKRPSYDVLAEQVNTLIADYVDVGSTPAATVLPADTWLDMAAIAKHPAASARATVGGQAATFPQLAFSVRELDPTSKTGVQTGLTFGPVDIAQYKEFFFRVTAARPQSPPDSLAEVRDKVREDYVKLHAYDLLKDQSDAIRKQIIDAGGFAELYESFPNGMTVRQDMSITQDTITPPQQVTPLPAANTAELRDAVSSLIDGWDPLKVPTDLPLEQRVLSVPLPGSLSMAFVIVTGHHPVTAGELRRNDYRVLSTVQKQWLPPDTPNPFSLEALKTRLHYVEVNRNKSDDEQTDDAPKEEEDPNTLSP